MESTFPLSQFLSLKENDPCAYIGQRIIRKWVTDDDTEKVIFPLPIFQILEAVGILGAGVAGLYTALILENLGIPYTIIEAGSRVGGRLYTHRFQNPTSAPLNYFDVGAMRFPETPVMSRVFKYLHDRMNDSLRPYLFSSPDARYFYNGLSVKQSDFPDPSQNPHMSAGQIVSRNPQPYAQYVQVGVTAIMDDVIRPYAEALVQDVESGDETGLGWQKLMEVDALSVRAYMATRYRPSPKLNLPDKPLSADVINWCETFDTSTGWFDSSFAETVLDQLAFNWDKWNKSAPPTDWFRIDGGSSRIAETMYADIRKYHGSDPIKFNVRVKRISQTNSGVTISIDGEDDQIFPDVICTLPLPVLRSIDMVDAGLTHRQATAMRQLDYGASSKIGMLFKTAWWKDQLGIIGGQTFSDSPLRTIVYPSDEDSTAIIASYCWTEDADRLAALIADKKVILIQLVLKELARIHELDVGMLRDNLIETFGWNWTQDSETMGAFALFGPGKFSTLYTSLTLPVGRKGRLNFAGEALSIRHAWVEGALESSWRAVLALLLRPHSPYRAFLPKFFLNWGISQEWFDKDWRPKELLQNCWFLPHIEKAYGDFFKDLPEDM
ncbi:hypothetical protein GYMLUDRAFT_1016410 [Collybiopsis luxurians FD-317 M1]|uniref:Amine oxidase domain-containing protein n=1 Tax=Collybiopsis luxurians FD-317 M1 TaxID=944289 RepID=A0A0D0AZS9_9AGAR|nr:hypothetical protein GYMLUDRAFT_1016410 [Collybiopsis luxurians FD-317 M1]